MLRRHVKVYQTFRVTRCPVRPVSTEVHSAPIRRKRGRPKADEHLTKKGTVSRNQERPTEHIESHGTGVKNEIVEAGAKDSSKSAVSRRKDSKSKIAANSVAPVKVKRNQTKLSMALRATPRLLARNPKHNDLISFRKYAENARKNPSSNVYKGTEYEYKVAEALTAYKFKLRRIGRSNDRGTDLFGYWTLPDHDKLPNPLNVIVQCKAYPPSPRMVRELDAAHAGAPAGWRNDEVFRLLVADGKSTKGVMEAVQRSPYPMGYMWMTSDQKVRQFRWNEAATRVALEGMGTTMKYGNDVRENEPMQEGGVGIMEAVVALTWMGNVWPKESKPRKKKEEAKD